MIVGHASRHMTLNLLAVSSVMDRRLVVLTHENNIRDQQAWAVPQGNVILVQRVITIYVATVASSTKVQSLST